MTYCELQLLYKIIDYNKVRPVCNSSCPCELACLSGFDTFWTSISKHMNFFFQDKSSHVSLFHCHAKHLVEDSAK